MNNKQKSKKIKGKRGEINIGDRSSVAKPIKISPPQKKRKIKKITISRYRGAN